MQHSRLFHGRLCCREHVVGNSDALITQKRSTHCFRVCWLWCSSSVNHIGVSRICSDDADWLHRRKTSEGMVDGIDFGRKGTDTQNVEWEFK